MKNKIAKAVIHDLRLSAGITINDGESLATTLIIAIFNPRVMPAKAGIQRGFD